MLATLKFACVHMLGLAVVGLGAAACRAQQLNTLPKLPPTLRDVSQPKRLQQVLQPPGLPGQNAFAQLHRPIGGDIRLSLAARVNLGKARFTLTSQRVSADETATADFEIPPEIDDFYRQSAREKIDKIDNLCGLDTKQRAKLSLAAQGDFSRIVREARGWHEKYAGVSAQNAQLVRAAVSDLAILNTQLENGFLQDNSMFSRVLKQLLSTDQKAKILETQFSEQIELWRLTLSSGQKQRLIESILNLQPQVVNPPILWEASHCAALIQELDRETLRKFLDDNQLSELQRIRELPVALKFQQR